MSQDVQPERHAGIMLALETSQREASVALRDRLGVIHEEPLSPRKRHDDDLLPAIDRLFTRAGLASKDLRGPPGGTVCVSVGPGGFTGLRIAVATAKMFAESLAVKLVAVPSALVAAETVRSRASAMSEERDGAMLVALACRNDSFWATRVVRAGDENKELGREAGPEGGGWAIAGEPGIVNAGSFDMTDIRAVIADEFFPDEARRRVEDARIPMLPLTLSAASVLTIGERMLARGETIDPLQLLPLYPRQPEAVTLWERRGLKA